jgi:hypothetical protein
MFIWVRVSLTKKPYVKPGSQQTLSIDAQARMPPKELGSKLLALSKALSTVNSKLVKQQCLTKLGTS